MFAIIINATPVPEAKADPQVPVFVAGPVPAAVSWSGIVSSPYVVAPRVVVVAPPQVVQVN
jgi:hypothetical protein